MYFDLPFDTETSVGGESCVIATYQVGGISETDALKKAGGFATGQTVGTWLPLPGVTRRMQEGYQARVLSMHLLPVEPVMGVLRVAFPMRNFADSFSMLQTALVGNDVSTALCVKLLDLDFTPQALRGYAGPRQSIKGVREAVGVYDRPLVLNMLKPCIGYTAEEGARIFLESAMGGVDLIKDDEVHGQTDISGVAERVEKYHRAAQTVRERTGRAPLYIPNITARPKQMRENARAVIAAGGRGVMVNFVSAGLDALWELSAEFGDRLFFLAHYAGAGMMSAPDVGYSNAVLLGVLPRLAGADMIMTMYPGRPDSQGYYGFLQALQKQRLPLGQIAPVFTTIGGGVTPLNLGSILCETGNDTILAVGGAIQGHPMGTAYGGEAVLAAIDCAMKNEEITQRARRCPALQAAIDAWAK